MTTNNDRRASMPSQTQRSDRYSTSSESHFDARYGSRHQAGPSGRPYASPPHRERDPRHSPTSSDAHDTRSIAARRFDRHESDRESDRRGSESYKRPRYDEPYPRNSQREPASSSRPAMSPHASDRYDRNGSHTHAHARPSPTSPFYPHHPTARNGAASSHDRPTADTGLSSVDKDSAGKRVTAASGSPNAKPSSSSTTDSARSAQTMSAFTTERMLMELLDDFYDKKYVAKQAEETYVYIEKFKDKPAYDEFKKAVEKKGAAFDFAKQQVSKTKTKCVEALRSWQAQQVELKEANQATHATSAAGSGARQPDENTRTPPQTPPVVDPVRLAEATKTAVLDQDGMRSLDEGMVRTEVQKALTVAIAKMRSDMGQNKSQQTAPEDEPSVPKQDTLSEDVQQLRELVERQQEELKEYKALVSNGTQRLAVHERLQADLQTCRTLLEAQSKQISEQQKMITNLESAFDRRAQVDREVMGVLANHTVALGRHERYVQETAAIMEQVPRTNSALAKPPTPLPRSN